MLQVAQPARQLADSQKMRLELAQPECMATRLIEKRREPITFAFASARLGGRGLLSGQLEALGAVPSPFAPWKPVVLELLGTSTSDLLGLPGEGPLLHLGPVGQDGSNCREVLDGCVEGGL